MASENIDGAIAAYRDELVAAASLGEAELAELEDHLRTMIEDLRGTGAVTAQVIAEARRRVGEPAVVAGECARIRTVFGTRIDPPRAVIAGVLLLAMAVWTAVSWLPRVGFVSQLGAEVGVGVILCIGLLARRAWPRPILFGFSAISAVSLAVYAWIYPEVTGLRLTLLVHVVAALLLAPWRRGELSRSGWALAGWAIAFGGGTLAIMVVAAGGGAAHLAPAVAPSALDVAIDRLAPSIGAGGFVLAALGTVLRARWGVRIGVVAAAAMTVVAVRVFAVESASGYELTAWQHGLATVMAVLAVIGGWAAPALAWRETKPGLGELRSLVVA